MLYKVLSILCLLLAFRAFYASIIVEASQEEIISLILQGFGSSIFALEFFLISRTPPTNINQRTEWLWRNGQRVLILIIIGILTLLGSSMLTSKIQFIN